MAEELSQEQNVKKRIDSLYMKVIGLAESVADKFEVLLNDKETKEGTVVDIGRITFTKILPDKMENLKNPEDEATVNKILKEISEIAENSKSLKVEPENIVK